MLKSVMTRRHSRHHMRLLAYLDTLEEAARDLGNSGTPSVELERYRTLLEEFCEFMLTEESQHEKEEERLLFPVIAQRMENADPGVGVTVKLVLEEHARGMELCQKLSDRLAAILRPRPAEGADDYFGLLGELIDVIWHFRRHVWCEELFIRPAAERLIPEQADQVWELYESATGQSGAPFQGK